MDRSQPIGVFDSGVGGLSVLREIRRELPNETLYYVADSAHIPYGEKSRQFVEARSVAITAFLLSRGAKAIVVACNTATGAAIGLLRSSFTLPIIGMEPAVKPAAEKTKAGVVAVLATNRTLSSDKFADLLVRFGKDVEVLVQPCAGLVEQVEAGELSGNKTSALLQRYILPLLEKGADTLVMGCTHYPFLVPLIREIAGPSVAIIDPSAAVAREVRRRLQNHELLSRDSGPGTELFWTSGALDRVRPMINQLWDANADLRHLPDEGTNEYSSSPSHLA